MRFLTTDQKQKRVNVYEELRQITSDDGLFTNNSSWQAAQSILHVTMTFYGDCMKMCEDFALNFGEKRIGCCITKTHISFFTRNFLPKNNMIVVPDQPYSPDFASCDFSVSPIEDKTRRPPF
jgi:hypothetical protein